MEEVVAFLAVGTFWFWALLVIEAIALFALVFNEKGTGATVTLILTLVLLNWVSKIPIVHYVLAHPLKTGLLVIGYFVAGTLWSIAKWWFFVRRRREKYDELRTNFLKDHNKECAEVPPELRPNWRQVLENPHYYTGKYFYGYCNDEKCGCGLKPLARNHKSDILRWMSYWPISLTCTLINDPVRKLFNRIFYAIQKYFQMISDSAFKGTEADFLNDAKDKESEKVEEGT